ncbi:MAG TPA: hypothetical protein PLE77_13565 [Kiritimatiellia bacterium]|mgnify:CR=1 FL=1|nr:hypothetical protein [Kiritimatiellia bacterium]
MGFLDRKSKSPYDNRLKELKKEAELVREDIRALSKAVRKPEEFEGLPKLKSSRYQADAVPPPSRKDPVKVPTEPPPRVTTGAEKPGDLFGWAGGGGQQGQGAAPAGYGRGAEAAQADAQRQRAGSKDERFANYFSSGNFLGASKPLKQEKNVQRNKAIFMVVIVVLVAFSVFRLMFR